MYRGREKNLKDSLVKIFNEKAGFDITVDVEYTEPVKEKEKKTEIFKFPSKQKTMQRQDNIPLQNTAELQNGMSMSKNGTDGMGSDIMLMIWHMLQRIWALIFRWSRLPVWNRKTICSLKLWHLIPP